MLPHAPLPVAPGSSYVGLLIRTTPVSKETTVSTPTSLPYAFVAKIVAADGQHDALGDLLASAVELANDEEGTIVWFAVRTHPDTFWIFDAFPDESARDAHANGAIVEALMANQQLLGAAPEILPADVLASKLP